MRGAALVPEQAGAYAGWVLEALALMLLPTVMFGAFALLAMWLGAESRPWFDERPVYDDRPNWHPIARRAPRDPDEPPPVLRPPAEVVRALVRRDAPATQPRVIVAPSSAAISPSGV